MDLTAPSNLQPPAAGSTPPAFPQVLDSTMLAAYTACPRKFWWSYCRQIASEGTNIHLHAGACYARGLEVARRSYYDEGRPADEAVLDGAEALLAAWGDVRAPDQSPKSVDRVLSAYEYYFYRYPMPSDYLRPAKFGGRSALEFNFVLPLPPEWGLNHPVTGEPLLYGGRWDMIADREGAYFGEDDKTTTALGATWSKKWQLRAQFTGYTWGAREYGIKLAGFVIRGISILKTGHDCQEAIIHRADWLIDAWLLATRSKITRMLEDWRSGYWQQAFDDACSNYGGCNFALLCDTPDPEPYLPIYYKHHVWDPTKRADMVAP